jgi:prepilin-type N-terminal cleavage/methylation domain-containing protein
MKLNRQSRPAKRGGFTLIELLVVITIIAVLVALTAAAVMRVLILGPTVTARTDITQLDNGVAAFQSKYGVNYIPSRIILRKFYSDYLNPATGAFNSQLDQDSVNYLTTVFHKGGQRFSQKWQDGTSGKGGINWHSNWSGVVKAPGPGELLEGDQCLVFFLGGIPATAPNGCLGFSTDDANPDVITPGNTVSFYEFKSNRLFTTPHNNVPSSFFSYQDAYGKGMPYIYFSAYGKDNGYNRYDKNGNYYAASGLAPVSDCLTSGVWPYAEAKPTTTLPLYRYLKKNTDQIICAGADGQFGPGTNITIPITSTTPYTYTSATVDSLPQAGQDDQANFVGNMLKAGQ